MEDVVDFTLLFSVVSINFQQTLAEQETTPPPPTVNNDHITVQKDT